MSFYSSKVLKQIALNRGYYTDEALAQCLAEHMGKRPHVIMRKINQGFTQNEGAVVASFLEMSPKEYCDTFLHGLFKATREGHYVCYVEDPKYLLMPPVKGKSKRKAKEEEILARLKELEEEYELQRGNGQSNDS